MPTEFLAPKIRQLMAKEDVSTLDVETSVMSKTGYKNVIEHHVENCALSAG